MNKNKVIIGVLIVAMMAYLPPAVTNVQANIPDMYPGGGSSNGIISASCGQSYYGKDIFGATVLKGYFGACWEYNGSTGNIVDKCTPTARAHAIVPFITAVELGKIGWTKQNGKNVAYGDANYELYDVYPEQYYTEVTVCSGGVAKWSMHWGQLE